MTKPANITIENKLKSGKSDLHIYHHGSRSAHLLSFNSLIQLPLETDRETDYLDITPVRGSGPQWTECRLHLPPWANIHITAEGKISLEHTGREILVTVPPGVPAWKLKITRPSHQQNNNNQTQPANQNKQTITISDARA